MKLKKYCAALMFSLFCMPLSALQADPGSEISAGDPWGISFSPVYSWLNGESNELVLQINDDPGDYLSQLIWELDSVHMVGGKASFNLQNTWFLNIAVITAVTEETGNMYDYDWLYTKYINNGKDPDTTTWTDKSVSEISLLSSYQLDWNLRYRFRNRRRWDSDFLVGFKRIFWSWTDIIVDYDYPYRDTDDSDLLNENGIDYRVGYNIPYLGLGFSLHKGVFTGGFTLLGSLFVNANSLDIHKYPTNDYAGDKYFYDSIKWGKYLGLNLNTKIYFGKSYAFSLGYEYERIFETQGDSFYITKYENSSTYPVYDSNSIGMSYSSSSLVLSLEFNY